MLGEGGRMGTWSIAKVENEKQQVIVISHSKQLVFPRFLTE